MEPAIDVYKRLSELKLENAELKLESAKLKKSNATLLEENKNLKTRVEELENIVKLLQKKLFGSSSEKSSKNKGKKPKINKGLQNKFKGGDEAESQESLAGGKFPDHLPREHEVVDGLPDDANPDDYTLVGSKITERLACKPAELYVIVTERRIYKKKDTGEFVTPPAPWHPLGRCLADVSLIVFLIIQKCLYHLPLYRLYQMLQMNGTGIARSNLASWVIGIAELLEPVVDALEASIKSSPQVHVDESPAKVKFKVAGAKKKYRQSYFWTLLSLDKGVVFKWTKTRTNKDAEQVLDNVAGVVVSDALNIYSHCTKKLNTPWQVCWVHIRRNFLRVSSNEVLAGQVLGIIQLILRLDKRIRRRTKNPLLRIRWRNRFVKPKLDELKSWLEDNRDTPEVQTDSALLYAVNYLDSRWEHACTFMTHPFVLPHNNDAEIQFRYLKLGAKNWLFASSEIGAKTIATLYSLLYSAKMQGINPYYYLTDILKQIEVPGVKAVDLIPSQWREDREKLVVPKHLQSRRKHE